MDGLFIFEGHPFEGSRSGTRRISSRRWLWCRLGLLFAMRDVMTMLLLERTTGRMHQSLSWATAAGCGGLFALLACRGRGCEYARVGIAVVDLAGVLGAVPPAMINGSIEPTGTTSLVLPGRVCTANMAAGAGTTGGALTVVYVENRVVNCEMV